MHKFHIYSLFKAQYDPALRRQWTDASINENTLLPASANSRRLDCFALIPFIPTGKAYRPMNTNHITTFRAKPFLFFIPGEMSNPKFINHFEIVDHAHSILLSVALIQLFQPGTWKTTTTIGTILAFAICDLFAISNSTSIAVFWFFTVLLIDHSTTWACVYFSNVSQAKTAVHSARCDQICGNCCRLFSSFWCHDLSVQLKRLLADIMHSINAQ